MVGSSNGHALTGAVPVPGNGISEQEKARRVPGVEFKETGAGRVACVAGMKIWQLIQTWREGGEKLSALREAHPHLREDQLHAALAGCHDDVGTLYGATPVGTGFGARCLYGNAKAGLDFRASLFAF